MTFGRSFPKFTGFLCLAIGLNVAEFSLQGATGPEDWPAWRGPTRDGIAAAGQTPPVQWSESENIVWRTPIPGRGHSSPTVVGDRIYLATADPGTQTQRVLCYDRSSGRRVWDTQVHQGNLDSAGHRNTSQASSTVACDGERLYINFLNKKGIHTSALDLTGKIVWQQTVGDFVTHQGFASSPVVHESVVLVTADHKGGGTLAGLDRQSGKVLWKHSRPKIANYTSPAVLHAAGRTQLVVAGCNLLSSFDPLTGAALWEIDSSTEECVTTAVTDGQRVFASGGYPKNHTIAIHADGSGKVAWQNTARVYVPSMIVQDGYLYAVMDAGIAVCWKSDTGEERWKERLGGDFYSSPVRVGQLIYATNLGGQTSVFEATPDRFKRISQNQLGNEVYATPAICGNRIFMRVAKNGDPREEFLYCIGSPSN
ncbi:MAG: serine/threonine protein kinase [Pedosphaera sp.]|nr:serine/threonine protein kinase [Pedosphaera sp.]